MIPAPSDLRPAGSFSSGAGRAGLILLASVIPALAGCGAGGGSSLRNPSSEDRQHVTWHNYGGGPDASKFVAAHEPLLEEVL